MKNFFEQLKNGLNKEIEIEETLNNYFNDNLVKGKQYSKYDWKGEKYYYELKSRDFEFNKYLTTIIPEHKIFTTDHRFVFAFTDGIYYIEYNKELFNTFKKKLFVCNPRYGIKDKPVTHIFIPITKLVKIDF